MDLIDNFRTFHRIAEYTFFSSAHGTFSRIDHILGQKSNLSKFQKIETVIKHLLWPQCYETKYQLQEKKKKNCKKHKHKRLNNTLLNNQQVSEDIRREIKSILETMTMKSQQLKLYGMKQKQF